MISADVSSDGAWAAHAVLDVVVASESAVLVAERTLAAGRALQRAPVKVQVRVARVSYKSCLLC